MFQGQLVSIHVTETGGGPMQSVEQAHAVPGQGVRGDRYFRRAGTFSKPPGDSDTDITLIELEAVEAAAREHNVEIAACEARRNLVTRGVPLNHLVGVEFFIGQVRLRGVRLCEPCKHLEKLTKKGIMKALAHRGGLRAVILSKGELHVGDTIGDAKPVNSAVGQAF
jgi:MOSC domain-containing protein YiiM